jgi:hypothetical protein
MDEVVVRFRLVSDEARALRRLSAEELRQPRDQVRYILRRELVQRGLLQDGDDRHDRAQIEEVQYGE